MFLLFSKLKKKKITFPLTQKGNKKFMKILLRHNNTSAIQIVKVFLSNCRKQEEELLLFTNVTGVEYYNLILILINFVFN